jgi:folate-binding protein YgfZ
MDVIRTTQARLEALRTAAIAVPDRPALFVVEGSGALTCLQGLLTSDLVAPGNRSLTYGAMLTPKGMIVVDHWVFRADPELLLVADRRGREPSAALLQRQLPPRLARVADRSDRWSALWLVGADPDRIALRALSAGPDQAGGGEAATRGTTGRVEIRARGGERVWVGRGPAGGPFQALVVGPPDRVAELGHEAGGLGALPGTEDDLRVARVLAGFPTLGAELGEKTLPQEVRYDDIGGLSYTKGCYVGQETVARLHFRGHPNWQLRGVDLEGEVAATDELTRDAKVVGRLTTVIVPDRGRAFGLASVRREVLAGAELATAGGVARVRPLP